MQTHEEATGTPQVNHGLGPLLSHLVLRDHKSYEIYRFRSSSKAFVLQLRRRGYQQGSSNSVYNRPTYTP